MDANAFLSYLQTNWTWALGLAVSMFGLTAFASMLNPERKQDVALWLMGAQTEGGWARGFVTLFDGVFGKHHLSPKCFLRSVVASLIAVVVIWLLMGNAQMFALRTQSEIQLGSLLLIGLAINVFADYVSLLETRWLLGRMPRNTILQVGVLILDFLISAAIIWAAIYLYLRSPLHEGEVETFAEILGVFSVFSVFFYSTFLTSVWTWGYVASTWVMRLASYLRLAFWLDVENKPIKVLFFLLSLSVGVVTLAGSLVFGGLLGADRDGISKLDQALCSVFKGRVCLDVADLTPTEQRQLEFLMFACEGGVTSRCLDRAFGIWQTDAATAAVLWLASCYGGDARGCANLGYLHQKGIGMDADPREAARLYRQACDGGNALGCNNLGYLHDQGTGVDGDPKEAARLFRQACDGGYALGCNNLGHLHRTGTGVDGDPKEAARLFRQACDAGNVRGCANLGYLHIEGIGVDADPQEAVRLSRQACDGGSAVGCNNLGHLHEEGIGVDADLQEAARLYRQACDGGAKQGCVRSEEMKAGQNK